MKAVVYTEYGTPKVLKLQEVTRPSPQPKEVLVKVRASTVSAGVIWIRRGKHPKSKWYTLAIRLLYGMCKPRRNILGYEFSGIVEEVGNQVQLFKKGDCVHGTTSGLKTGAYAGYVCIPEKRKHGVISIMPKCLDFKEAAAVPIGGMTALYILEKAQLKKGERILIYGASGSVGTYAVQLAKYYEAKVTGVCSTDNVAMVKSIGADETIDYIKQDIALCNNKYDVVFDAVDKIPASILKNLVKKGGRFLSVCTPTLENTKYLSFLNALTETGQLKPIIDRTYTLEEIVEANNYVEMGHKKGNVVIEIKDTIPLSNFQ